MDERWYYAKEGKPCGPVSFEGLRALVLNGSLQATDLVWQPAFGSEWRGVGHVRELFVPGASDAPPVPSVHGGEGTSPSASPEGGFGQRPSALHAIEDAWERMWEMLFRPFDLTRWFSVGFCAWLAQLGTQASFNYKGASEPKADLLKQQADRLLDRIVTLSEHPAELLLGSGTVLIGLLIAYWFCSLRSRGDFMFLRRWYQPETSIRECWQASQTAGHDLFVWRIKFFLVAAVLVVGDLVLAYRYVAIPYRLAGKVWHPALMKPAVLCMTGAVLLALAVQLVAHFAKAFVVPLMYGQRVTVARAWRIVFSLINQYPFAVLWYLLCALGCSVSAMVLLVVVALMTCCVGVIPMMLPYVGTVMVLPVCLFFRGYPVCFLNQWRPELVPGAPRE